MNKRIEQCALSLKQKYGTNDPLELCRCLGITFLKTDLPRKLSGFYMEKSGRQAIAVSEALSSTAERAVIAHELGHALLHRGLNLLFLCENTNFVQGRYEREADMFAAALLIDKNEARSGDRSLEDVSRESGVPLYAVEAFIK